MAFWPLRPVFSSAAYNSVVSGVAFASHLPLGAREAVLSLQTEWTTESESSFTDDIKSQMEVKTSSRGNVVIKLWRQQ